MKSQEQLVGGRNPLNNATPRSRPTVGSEITLTKLLLTIRQNPRRVDQNVRCVRRGLSTLACAY